MLVHYGVRVCDISLRHRHLTTKMKDYGTVPYYPEPSSISDFGIHTYTQHNEHHSCQNKANNTATHHSRQQPRCCGTIPPPNSRPTTMILPLWQCQVFGLIVFPFLASLYAVGVPFFLASWGEGETKTHLKTLAWNLCLYALLPSMVVLSALFRLFNEKAALSSTTFALTFAFSTMCFRDLTVQTRIQVVEGGTPPTPPSGFLTWSPQTFLVTGANAGIGKETVRWLALHAQEVNIIMACRDISKGNAAKAEIEQEAGGLFGAQIPFRLFVVQLDLCDFASVRRAAQLIRQKFPKIDVLINNAGLMKEDQVITKDGYDMVMQANHLGPYLFTRLLLPHLEENARILCLTSSTYSFAGPIDLDDLFCTKGTRPYTLFGQYAQSKLANILFVKELARQTKFFCAAVHPGLVRTDVVRNMPWYLRYPNEVFAPVLATLQKTPAQGAWNTVYLAMAPNLRLLPGLSGKYWVNRQTAHLFDFAKDESAARSLWLKSARYVRLEQ